MEDALARFPDSSEVLLFFAEVSFRVLDTLNEALLEQPDAPVESNSALGLILCKDACAR